MEDRFGRSVTYMRVSVTENCNLRCRYCMPEDEACPLRPEPMSEEEIVLAVRAAAALGVGKLRVTGGEPLIRKDIISICERSARIEGIDELCITTNGLMLPSLARPLREAGVSRVNMSLDTLDEGKYQSITRGGKLGQALRGLEAALSAGFEKIKLNAVLIGGFNEDEIPALAELTRQYPVDMRFIELMPMVGEDSFPPEAFLPYTAVLEALPEAEKAEEEDGGVAKLYRLPGAQGNIGLISPLSAHFCASCNRLRLTADGKLKPCLHSSEEYSIRGLSYEETVEQMKAAILAKPAWHGVLTPENRSPAGRNMNQIGG